LKFDRINAPINENLYKSQGIYNQALPPRFPLTNNELSPIVLDFYPLKFKMFSFSKGFRLSER